MAESLTGGLIASRLVNVAGASKWFRGGVVGYASDVKYDSLGVPKGPVVSADAARAMAEGVRRVLGADIGLSVTGVAGPEEQDGSARDGVRGSSDRRRDHRRRPATSGRPTESARLQRHQRAGRTAQGPRSLEGREDSPLISVQAKGAI